jgi:long-chain acyl-CoA synthetase
MQRRLTPQRCQGRTVPALLCLAAQRAPAKVFIHYLDPATPGAPPRQVTFAGFRRGVAQAAATFAGAGLGPGDRLLAVAENSP